jgi:hypothetical protein
MIDAVQKLYFTYCIKSCPIESQKVQGRYFDFAQYKTSQKLYSYIEAGTISFPLSQRQQNVLP